MKSKKVLASLLALSVLASSTLLGCGNKEEAKPANKTENSVETTGEKDKDQTYNVCGHEPDTLDPNLSSSDTAWRPQGFLYEGLTRYTPTEDGLGKIDPGVAEKWNMSKDGLKYTFNIRKDAKWSDGKRLTAKDFEYSWKRAVDPKNGAPYQALFNGIVKNATEVGKNKKSIDELGIKAIDDYTFEVTLEKPCGYFMELTYFPVLKPVRKDVIDKHGKKYGTEADTIVGNGAYTLKEWTNKNKMAFVKNENYWDKENVFLSTMNWKIIRDENARMQAYQTGEIDSVFVVDGQWIEKFKQDTESIYDNTVGNSLDYFILNFKNKYFANEKIRKAMAISFSREGFIDVVANGLGKATYGLIPDSITMGGTPYTKLVDNKFIKKIMDQNKDPKKLFMEGLKEVGGEQDPNKLTFRIYTRGTSEQDKQEAEYYSQQWKENLGINIKLEQMDYNIMYKKIEAGDFDIGLAGWSADWNDPSAYLDNHNSDTGYYKTVGWVNKKFNTALLKAKETMDMNERAKLYGEAEKILIYDDTAIIPIYFGMTSTFRKKYIKNYKTGSFGFGDLKGVYISGRNK
ncbi:peptide ABC transporter substrate-binding protein [Hathewaya histolytica]|uniref:peptide ABC transporter substrate-binding protein n=1 Tax=Hathewaya histolytica TaxID=1498 RepID=UPI003B679F2B